MGTKSEKWCDMCAVRTEYDANIIAMSRIEVVGHEPIQDREYKTCDACTQKLRDFLDTQKAASDAKWDRLDPKALDVVL